MTFLFLLYDICMVLVKWPHMTSVELVWSYSLMAVHDWLVKCSLLNRIAVGVTLTNAYCVIHTTRLSDHDCFTALNTTRTDPHKKLSFLRKLVKVPCKSTRLSINIWWFGQHPPLATQWHSTRYYCWTTGRVLLLFHNESWSPIIASNHLIAWEYIKYSLRKRASTGKVVFPPTFIFCEMVKRWVVLNKSTARTRRI